MEDGYALCVFFPLALIIVGISQLPLADYAKANQVVQLNEKSLMALLAIAMSLMSAFIAATNSAYHPPHPSTPTVGDS